MGLQKKTHALRANLKNGGGLWGGLLLAIVIQFMERPDNLSQNAWIVV